MFQRLRELSAPGSMCVATMLGGTGELFPGTGPSKMHHFFTDTGAEFIASCGWSGCTQQLLNEVALAYGRTKVPPTYAYYFVTGSVA